MNVRGPINTVATKLSELVLGVSLISHSMEMRSNDKTKPIADIRDRFVYYYAEAKFMIRF